MAHRRGIGGGWCERGKKEDDRDAGLSPIVSPRVTPFHSLSQLQLSNLLILLAGEEGLEPPTPGFGDRCSNQIELHSYRAHF